MKRCITAHTVASFGDIPEGSLWSDESPFVLEENAACFVQVEALTVPEPAKPAAPVRKFGAKQSAARPVSKES